MGGRRLAFGLAMIWSALFGTFFGAIMPFWEAQIAMAEANDALNSKHPDLSKRRDALKRAIDADAYGVEPRLALIDLEFRLMMERGSRRRRPDLAPDPQGPHRREEAPAQPELDGRRALPGNLRPRPAPSPRGQHAPCPRATAPLRGDRRNPEGRTADPTALHHAELAEALADLGEPEAAREAAVALALHENTSHRDKKLPPAILKRLQKLR